VPAKCIVPMFITLLVVRPYIAAVRIGTAHDLGALGSGAWASRKLVLVDRFFPSSRLCSNCGQKNQKFEMSDLFSWGALRGRPAEAPPRGISHPAS
jgi:hypothetical protein